MSKSISHQIGVVLAHSGGQQLVGDLRFEQGAISLELTPGFIERPIILGPDVGLYAGRQFCTDPRHQFGFLEDASPDRWGRDLMQRRAAMQGQNSKRTLTSWDYLTLVQDAGRLGAIRFLDNETGRYIDDDVLSIPQMVDLRELESASLNLEKALEEDDLEAVTRWVSMLFAPGSSLGGARPKANVVDQHGVLHIAKFPGREDRIDVGLWERIYSELGKRAGTVPAASHVAKFASSHHTYLTRRFDRAGEDRLHYLSAMALSGKRDGSEGSYLDVIEALESHADPAHFESDLRVLFRRLLFNVLAGNRDDHLRNHGFLVTRAGVRLSPAFDVNPSPDKGSHAITLDGYTSEPDLSAALKTAEFFGLKQREADCELKVVQSTLSDWRSVAKNMGAKSVDMQLVSTLYRWSQISQSGPGLRP